MQESPVRESTLPTATLPSEPPVQRPRLRAFIIGLPIVCGLCILSVYADMVSKVVQFGVLQFAPPAIFALFAVALLNRVLGKADKKFLNRADLIVIYSMSVVAVLVSTRGVIEKLVPSLVYLPYYATRENKFNELMTRHLPPWLVPFTPTGEITTAPPHVAAYFDSGSSVPWSAWIPPLLAWLGLWLCVLLVFFSLATLLRRQWMDNEQLRFPLTTLPLAIINDKTETGDFFKNPLMWSGAAVSAFVFLVNGLAANYPDVPKLFTDMPLNSFFSDRPWNAMDYTPIYFSLAAVGFAYFLPLDLLFSLWFFFLFTRFQDIMAVQFGGLPTGIGTHNARIFTGFQAAGAYIVLVLAQIRIGWPYFRQMLRGALGIDKPLDDSKEMMPYRMALGGILVGFAGIVIWLTVAGMSPWLAALQMGLFIFFIALIMTRAVSEAGLLMTETSFLPAHLIALLFPLHGLGDTNLTMMGLTNAVFIRDQRGGLLSTFFDTQKLAKEVNMPQRALLLPLTLAFLVAFGVAATTFLKFNYAQGGTSLYAYSNKQNPDQMFKLAAGWIQGQETPRDSTAWGGLGMGIALTAAMVWARSQFAWFPFHPLGYAIAPTWAMIAFWFPMLVAWVFKGCVMRFGGVDTWRKWSPFMLGLIVGEFGMAVFWSLMNMTRGWNAPSFPWP